MAYFIVIGTGNDVKDVVDGIKDSHLQHNIVTSGCIVTKGEGLFYHWDIFNEKDPVVRCNPDAAGMQCGCCLCRDLALA